MNKTIWLLCLIMLLATNLMAAPTRVLMVVTSTDKLQTAAGEKKTGCWPEELIAPYLLFNQAGFTVTIASPRGGAIPFDTAGFDAQVVGSKVARRLSNILDQTPYLRMALPLAHLCKNPGFAYDVIFLVGGHGAIVDFYNNPHLTDLLQRACARRAIIAGVCHGVVGLLNLRRSHWLRGASVTGFSNQEEDAIQMSAVVKTYLGDSVQNLLDRMVRCGKLGGYQCAPQWQSKVVNYANRLLTGQNPQSSASLAREIIRVVKSLSRNPVKAAIQKGYPVFGAFVTIGHPTVAETLALSGVDFIWIEGEHAALSLPQILTLNLALSESKAVPIIRVPSNNHDTIKQYVDTGAMGIIVPYIKTAADAAKAVRALKYPPLGERGVGLGRATRYFIKIKPYLQRANRDVMVILMIETKAAVANIEAILQVPGIDMLSIGPFDLSASMGHLGQPQHPEVVGAIAKVEQAARKANIPLGISVPDKHTAYAMMARGYRFFVIGADVEYLYQSAKKFLAPKPMAAAGWKIDTSIKFHYAYSASRLIAKTKIKQWDRPTAIDFIQPGQPDIDNISLAGILGLGFPVPTRSQPENFKYFLKFYAYPKSLNAVVSAHNILDPFLIYKLKQGAAIYRFASRRKNVYVKKGLVAGKDHKFDRAHPFPRFKVPLRPINNYRTVISPQALFDSSIPFASLYVTPEEVMPSGLKRERRAEWSVQGMLNLHRQLLRTYRRALIEVAGSDSARYHYFLKMTALAQPGPTAFSVLKIPKQPLVFSNFQDLPMPQDPKRIFLSGLLLVYHSDYIGDHGQNLWQMVVDSSKFQRQYRQVARRILEIGSVVNF